MKKVLIVGAGPVGLLAGCYLYKYNIAFDIIDKNSESNTYSKALSVSPATIKAFHGLNISDKLVNKGRKVHSIQIYYKDRKFLNINNKYLPSCYRYHISIPQPETEKILEEFISNSGVYVKRGHKLISWTKENGKYKVSISDGNNNQYTSCYEYIIGADGASSTVRDLAGIGFDGHDYNMHFIMADVLFESSINLPGTSYYIDDDGFLIFLPMPDNMVRVVIKKDGPLPSPRPTPDIDEINYYLSKYCKKSGNAYKLIWSSSANFYNRIAEHNSKDNVFIAGDAFHLFSPIGGQGMNTGIQDAINLSWKLALYIKGKVRRALLDTYSTQRFTAVGEVLQSTDHDTMLIAGIVPKECIDPIYYPEFCNRNHYQSELPLKYSGFLASQKNTTTDLVGRHVPYFEFFSNQHDFNNSYDALSTGKVIIYSKRNDCPPLDRIKNKSDFIFCSLDESDCLSIEHIQFNSENYVVVNPDGYIDFSGKEDDLIEYLSAFYFME
ncbi:FAD-dependent monooxygenase [Vibrio ruber]|uniref:FAD-dependent monooxygenase n=1 Tax=Vibrio ruber TaxID=184755 RepID=UPI0028937BBD|nr:FAD-dependent monooxygenase [Vibrio ruber]WNJ97264.1 FAD-dependent monooxygenase [Vibrio ruber]